MISPLTGTKSTEEKSKQNITRDIEIKNNVTIARGEWGEGFTGGGTTLLIIKPSGQGQLKLGPAAY